MNLLHLSLAEQGIFVLAALILLASFFLIAQVRLVAAIHSFAWQGALIAAVTFLVAGVQNTPHLLVSAVLTLLLKAIGIPWILHFLVRKMGLEREMERLQRPALTLLVGTGLVIFSYWAVLPIERLEFGATRNIIAISLAVVLLGLWCMVARHQVIVQVLGFMSMENGLFLAAVASTKGMPLVVELGVAFDVLVAAILFGIFFLQIRENLTTLDADRLNRLSEKEER